MAKKERLSNISAGMFPVVRRKTGWAHSFNRCVPSSLLFVVWRSPWPCVSVWPTSNQWHRWKEVAKTVTNTLKRVSWIPNRSWTPWSKIITQAQNKNHTHPVCSNALDRQGGSRQGLWGKRTPGESVKKGKSTTLGHYGPNIPSSLHDHYGHYGTVNTKMGQ